MKRIFIASVLNKLRNAVDDSVLRQFNERVSPSFSINSLISQDKNGIFQAGLNSDSEVIIIDDTHQELGKIKIDLDNDYLLYHAQTSDPIKTSFKYKVSGHNMPEPTYLYGPVLNKILDEEQYKAERIIEFLFPSIEKILDVKLNSLHLCLTPGGAKIVRKVDDYQLIKEEVESFCMPDNPKLRIIDYLAKQDKSDCFDEEKYIKPLSLLRDKLLAN